MQNTLFTGDNLYILNGMNSESVDLIYLDPPFNSKRMYSGAIGSKAANVSFKDMWTWKDVDEYYLENLANKHAGLVRFIESIESLHSKAMMAYIVYMTQRLIECHRILKNTGSIYLHCDPTASHYLKAILDELFGKDNFKNEIIWKRSSAHNDAKKWGAIHDVILFYSKSKNSFWNTVYLEYDESYIKKFYKHEDENGVYQLDNITAPGKRGPLYEFLGVVRYWRYTEANMKQLYDDGLIVQTSPNAVPRFKRYLEQQKGVAIQDVIIDINPLQSKQKEATGYPTQKPVALLERIIKASSKIGDIIFDPFCGCATTCVAAQQLGRKWIGIDIEKQAVTIVMDRLKDTEGQLFTNFINLDTPPKRTDIKEEKISQTVKERLFAEQNAICNGCCLQFNIQNFEVDHIVPKSKGGGDYYENYQLLCSSCNRIKGARPMEYLRMKIKAKMELLKDTIKFGE